LSSANTEQVEQLNATIADLTAKLSSPAEELPQGETESGSQEITVTEETEQQLKIKKTVSAMKANIDFIEEQKKKKVSI